MANMMRFPIERVERDNCPECGAILGVFERKGSGRCNACLSKPAKRMKRRKVNHLSARERIRPF